MNDTFYAVFDPEGNPIVTTVRITEDESIQSSVGDGQLWQAHWGSRRRLGYTVRQIKITEVKDEDITGEQAG